MKKFGLTALALLALWGGNLCAQVGYTYDSASNNNFSKAFDGNINTKFEGGNLAGNWLIIKTSDSQPHVVKSYAISTHDDGSWPNRAPKTWTLEGSNDKSNWTLIDQVTNDPIENKNYTTFTFKDHFNFNAYTYLRFTMLTMKGTGWTQIAEFAVTDVAEADVETFRASKKTEYQTKVSELQAEVDNFKSTLGEDDPWTLEFISKCEGLSDLLNATTADYNYEAFGSAYNIANTMVSLKNQFTGSSYSAIDGSATWGDGHWTQLFDGKDGREGREGTKWGAHFSSNDAKQYVIFRVKEAFKPFFYKLVTGGDTKDFKGRNWKTWNVYGANFESLADATYDPSKWTKLDARENITEEYLPFENNYPASFNFNQYPEGLPESYLYYMIEVIDSYTRNQGTQMNEMALCTQAEFDATRDPLVAEFNDFDTTRPIESDFEDELTQFNTLFDQLKTTADAIQLTKLYNQCVALRTVLEANMDWVELNIAATPIDGVYQLGTAANLVLFSKVVNGGKGNLNAVLTADIDLNDVAMNPIGSLDNPYKGTFDGKGKAIKNFTYDQSGEGNVGLFGLTSGATIKKVLLSGANINGNANAAGLVGNAQKATTIENCAVVDSRIEGRDHVAAIAGNAIEETVIRNNYSDAEIVSRQYQAGGMVGTIFSATIEKNLFAGTVTCQNSGIACGLVSRIDGIADPAPVVRNNMVAASAVTGGETHSIIKADWNDRPITFADNYTLKSIVYTEGGKVVQKNLTNKDDLNGMQLTDKEATCKSFYETLGWDMENDWKFVAAGQFPVLAYMDANVPAPQEITVSKFGYATVVAENALDFTGSEAEAYIAQVKVAPNETLYVHLEPITIVPAGEPFVVKAAANTYNIPVAVEWGVAEGNDLKASKTDIVADGTQYVLANAVNGVGFYKAEGNIPAGKGYIELNGTGPLVKALFFAEEDATGIANVNVNDNVNNGAIYNIAGQKLSKLQKGINIVNGRKVLY
jgi:hypothetical protein